MTEVFLSSETMAQPPLTPCWNTALPQLGNELKRLRLKQSLTLRQLHYQTQIPLHHLEALEMGDMSKLPPPVYVRGFIQRICHVLGDEGKSLQEQLPPLAHPVTREAATATQDKPSWLARPRTLQYVCAAVLTGAVGYTLWIMQQERPVAISIPASPQVLASTESPWEGHSGVLVAGTPLHKLSNQVGEPLFQLLDVLTNIVLPLGMAMQKLFHRLTIAMLRGWTL